MFCHKTITYKTINHMNFYSYNLSSNSTAPFIYIGEKINTNENSKTKSTLDNILIIQLNQYHY